MKSKPRTRLILRLRNKFAIFGWCKWEQPVTKKRKGRVRRIIAFFDWP